jgi:hypothetical protein
MLCGTIYDGVAYSDGCYPVDNNRFILKNACAVIGDRMFDSGVNAAVERMFILDNETAGYVGFGSIAIHVANVKISHAGRDASAKVDKLKKIVLPLRAKKTSKCFIVANEKFLFVAISTDSTYIMIDKKTFKYQIHSEPSIGQLPAVRMSSDDRNWVIIEFSDGEFLSGVTLRPDGGLESTRSGSAKLIKSYFPNSRVGTPLP